MSAFTTKDAIPAGGAPVIVFHCDSGSLAHGSSEPDVPGSSWIRVPCIGRVSEGDVLRALRSGAPGVLLLGCDPGRCKFHEGDARAEETVARVQGVLARRGLSAGRVAVIRAGGRAAGERAVALAVDGLCTEQQASVDTAWMRRAMPASARWPHHGAVQEAALLGHARATLRDGPPGWAQGAPAIGQGAPDVLYSCDLPALDHLLGEPFAVEAAAVRGAALRLLQAAGLNPAVSDGLPSCGHDFALVGDRLALSQMAPHVAGALEATGARRVLTLCPECERTLQEHYPRVGVDVEASVSDTLTVLHGRRGELDFQPGLETPVAVYADADATTTERLDRAVELLEAAGYRVVARLPDPFAEAEVRGGAGVMGFVECDQMARGAQERLLGEAAAAGAVRLLCVSPLSAVHLRCARRRGGWRRSSLNVSTIYEALAERLSPPREA